MPHTLPLQLSTAALADMIDSLDAHNAVIVEQCPLEHFVAGHIPHARHLDFKRLQRATGPAGLLPETADIEQVLTELCITPDTHIIASDHEGGGWAGRLIWVLDCIGHRRYSYLDGGSSAWQHEGRNLESGEQPWPAKAPYHIEAINHAGTIDAEALINGLEDGLRVWDARSLAEHTGEKALAQRAGRIPGAKHYEWTRAMDKTHGLRLRPLAEIQAELDALGLSANTPIATHCQSHHRSGLTYLLGKLLGLDVRAYAGSWSEWGNRTDTPIERG